MPPTIQNSVDKRNSRSLGGTGVERRSELVTRVKYGNTLPDLPFDPKFIAYPFSSTRFVEYSTTSLEKNNKYEVLTEIDLGVDVELVIPNFYDPPKNTTLMLDHKDERLLEDDNLFQKNQKRSRHHAKSVSWLRRTEYISTEQTRFQPQTIDKVEAKVGYSIKKSLKEDMHSQFADRDSQIANIEGTFKDAQAEIETHFSKPGVVPLEVLPVFPDFSLWKYPCAQVIFDSDPAPVSMHEKPLAAQIEEMSQAMIRGVMDESGEQFVAYFLPTEETLQKRRRDQEAGIEYDDDDVYEYKMAREYNWNVKTKATKGYEETYFFVMRDNGVFYNELETKVRLNKRRTRGPNHQLNTKLCVTHVPMSLTDNRFHSKREKQLEPLQEEEEEEIEEKSEDEKNENEKSADEKERSDNESTPKQKKDSDSEDEKSDHEETRGKPKSGTDGSEKSDSEDDGKAKREADKNRSEKSDSEDGGSGSGSGSGSSSSDSSDDDDEGRKSD